MIRNMGKAKAQSLYDRATHCRKRSGSSATSYRRSAFVDHEGIQHHPEHFFFRTATPPQFCRWPEEGSEDSDSDSDSDLDTAPSPAFLGHHQHHYSSPRYRQRQGSVASSSLSATLPPTSFFLPSLELPPLPTPPNLLPVISEPVTTIWVNQTSMNHNKTEERGRFKPINGFRRNFESLKLEFRIGLLRTRKRMAKVWNRL